MLKERVVRSEPLGESEGEEEELFETGRVAIGPAQNVARLKKMILGLETVLAERMKLFRKTR
jgi:hypothetical protein